MKYIAVFFPLIFIGMSSCEQPVCCDPGPESFLAVIHTQEGNDYLRAHADDSVALYYYENEQKVPLELFISTYKDSAVVLHGVDVPVKSAAGAKHFYLQVSDDVDTLYIDVRKKKWKYRSVRFNGEAAQRVTSSMFAPRWYFKKN